MKISVIKGSKLTDEQVQRWREIQDGDFRLASPYFCPEFIQSLSSIRNDVWVSVISINGKIIGFFPFQKRRFRFGIPAGGMLSDIHGLIIEDGIKIDLKELLRQSGLISYDFHSIPQWQNNFECHFKEIKTFHYIDLTHGYENYKSILAARKSKFFKDAEYKFRKLSRDFNDVEFQHFVSDNKVLDQLISWKSQQYRKSKLVDVFSFPWTRALLYEIHAHRHERFSGILSVLKVDGKIIAIHMGMCSLLCWNWWFPRHDPEFNKYSPGLLLRFDACKHAEKIGMKFVDLGCGDETTYKPHLSTNTINFGSGSVEIPSIYIFIRRIFNRLTQWARNSDFYSILRIPGRLVFKILRKSDYI
jgi:CelD/BcsL family acetyltransferase involved in cellulose biosynthesis